MNHGNIGGCTYCAKLPTILHVFWLVEWLKLSQFKIQYKTHGTRNKNKRKIKEEEMSTKWLGTTNENLSGHRCLPLAA